MSLEDVPFLQKRVIDKARRNAKPVIVATQMLESMISNPAPTRAEASDVANAVLDGTDAVMLSGETSVGEYPIETVETMARIISSTEDHELANMAAIDWQPLTRGGVIAKAAAEVADRVDAKYLVAFTQSGDSARRMSRYRGRVPLLAFTPVARVRSQLSLTWGVETFLTQDVEHTDEMVRQVDEALLEIGRVKQGDLVVIIAGSPPGIAGSTNALRIHRMGDAINEVAPAYKLDPTGLTVTVSNVADFGAGSWDSEPDKSFRTMVFETTAYAVPPTRLATGRQPTGPPTPRPPDSLTA